MKRRHFTLTLAGLLSAPTTVFAGGKAFLYYTQDELDKAYDQRNWAPNSSDVIARYTSDSSIVRKKYPPRIERYGSSEAESLDIFVPEQTGKNPGPLPVMVFVHGGAWRGLTKEDSSAAAPTFLKNGCIYVALNFATIPAVRLPDMARQCRNAMLWLNANVAKFGGDPQRIFVSGHSSGGHLSAVLLTTDWASLGAPTDLIKGGVTISGMYELYPVLLSARSNYIKVSGSEIVALSPIRHLDKLSCPIIVANGDKESPEFQRQARVFSDALAGMGKLHSHIISKNKNHFEVAEDLNAPQSTLSRSVINMINTQT